MRCMKAALAVVGCGALAFSLLLLVLVVHSTVGMVAAPGLIMVSSLVMLVMKKLKREKREAKRKQKEGMDVAAKGIYVVIKDFDMMSRLVQNLGDEMEHRKLAAEVCVKKGKNGALKEVAREFQEHELGFWESWRSWRNRYTCVFSTSIDPEPYLYNNWPIYN